ncbi:hypothetical protein QFZ55_000233 [Streptomyces luteogriseus]|uniref:hypothetical protein n=1 Tax=Streptomyces luteogriseus TaxID=68233 RepID=UPI0027813B05|nr:hypothetical protein [Streptomyces luteogriseus]MDQ0710781.1 hypothetical protein [Streptomyces luteogriseus]
MRRALPDADTVKAAIDSILEHAAATGRRPTVATVERRLGIPHATFHRHYSDLIDEHFRPHIPAPAQPAPGDKTSGHTEANLRRLRQENTDLSRALELYEEAIRQLALEKRRSAPGRRRPAPALTRPTDPEATVLTCAHPLRRPDPGGDKELGPVDVLMLQLQIRRANDARRRATGGW